MARFLHHSTLSNNLIEPSPSFPWILWVIETLCGFSLMVSLMERDKGKVQSKISAPLVEESEEDEEFGSDQGQPTSGDERITTAKKRKTTQQVQVETKKRWVDSLQMRGFCCERQVDIQILGTEAHGVPQMTTRGAKLPLYAFKKVNKISSDKDLLNSEDRDPPVTFLNSLLLGEWEDRVQKGLFRYDVTACETKVIPGEYGFIAQLNEGRHLKKRPTEFRVDKVLQPFDGNKFNFTKVGQEEVLFQFEASENNEINFFPDAPIDVENSPSVVVINVSPIEYGHVLLIPRILECLPQRIDRDCFLLALYMAAEAGNPYFRLGYNSLGAFATINHLHFQAYYFSVPFPIEKASTRKLTAFKGGVIISELVDYPVRGLVFEGGNTLEDLSNAVSDSCIHLQENNIPYNVLISDSAKRIFVIPQCYAEKQALGEVNPELLNTQVNPAVWEISGHMVLKRKKDYEEASEANAWRLLAEVSLSEQKFQEVNALIFEAIFCGDEENVNVCESLLEEDPDDKPQSLVKVDALDKGSGHAMVSSDECLVLQ